MNKHEIIPTGIYKVSEAAIILGMSVRQVNSLIKRGIIYAPEYAGMARRISGEELLKVWNRKDKP